MKLWTAEPFNLAGLLLLASMLSVTSAVPAHHRQIAEAEITNQTRHLLKLTQELLKDHVIGTDIEHRFKTLPAMANRVADLSTLEVKSTLAQLHSDIQLFDLHFEWLNKALKNRKHASFPKLGELIQHLKLLKFSLQRQMTKLQVLRPPTPSPSLPSTDVNEWEVVQSSLELFQKFRLFCDWALRVFLSLKLRH
ncbi:interleukin-11-like [Scleropages formosus]|uniref:Interleukin 11a n=1 Tax=Scleropages formosus TaxID=113540 RepID=A0A0P7XG98_SCLFO|nr:interleukin-11 [Scleropages formosus]KPP75226.1 interleukin-11-like [Scleropages formosus]